MPSLMSTQSRPLHFMYSYFPTEIYCILIQKYFPTIHKEKGVVVEVMEI